MTSILVTRNTSADSDITAEYPRISRYTSSKLLDADLSKVSLTKRKEYQKPTERPLPVLEFPVQPEEIKPHPKHRVVKEGKVHELLYHFGRSSSNQELSRYPNWKQFNCQIFDDTGPVSMISFNPILMATPTDFSTIYTSLLQAKETAAELGFENTVVFFDMGLLTRALEIVWARPDELKGVIPLAGGMHLLMSYIASIGYLFGDAGLKQLLHESDVFAAGTVNNMLSGKDFDRAIYGLHLIDEAFHGLLIKQFQQWCQEKGKYLSHDMMQLLSTTATSFEANNVSKRQIGQASSLIESEVMPLMEKFLMEGSSSSSNFKL